MDAVTFLSETDRVIMALLYHGIIAVNEVTQVLQTHFGYSSLKPGQERVVCNVLDGVNTLAVLPTGGGKSLCYQLPALMKEGLSIVVSPLIALMQDQVQRLRQLGVRAAAFNSTLSPGELRAAEDARRKCRRLEIAEGSFFIDWEPAPFR